MDTKLKMKAPDGVSTALIEGHEYEVPKNGVIDIVSPHHGETLRRHNFTDVASDGLKDEIESTNDKDRLVEIIEEHGGDADSDMKLGKLRRMARESLADDEDEDDEDEADEKPAKKSRRKSKKA